MMRERELRQVKNQLKCQTSKTQQQAAVWRKRMEEKEEQMRMLLVQKDAEMQSIVSQLLLFEAELRQEQSRIEDLLSEKDARILSQQKEIDQLKRCCLDINKKNTDESRNDSTVCSQANSDRDTSIFNKYLSQESNVEDLPIIDTHDAVRKLKDGLMKIRAIQDVTNVKANESSYTHDSLFPEKRRVPTKPPQKMKDLKAKRINHHKGHRAVVTEFSGQAIL